VKQSGGPTDSDGHFNAAVASVYGDDTVMFSPGKTSPVADFLADLAGEGAALEFGIGTGRSALPLAAQRNLGRL